MLLKLVFVLGMAIIGSATDVCNLKGQWAPSCKDPHMVRMDAPMKRALVIVHNKLRNEIALGKISNYSPAANMETMIWDDSLAAKAALNVHQCEMKHDNCRATDKFPLAGQNLAKHSTTGAALKSPSQVANLAKLWFESEQQNGAHYGWMEMINKLPSTRNKTHVIGHFTQYVWAGAQKIGCAVSMSKTKLKGRNATTTWLACNYNTGNIIGRPVYEAGPPASKCKTGKNTKYPGLCSRRKTKN